MEDVSTEGFVRVGDPVAGPLVTTDALKLHTYGVVASITNGDPGFISFDYLSAISVETALPALELTLAGLWTVEGRGYRISEDETLRVARVVERQLARLAEFDTSP